MWALRRASNPLKNRGISIRLSIAACNKSELPGRYSEDRVGLCESLQVISDGCLSLERFYLTAKVPSKFSIGRRSLSSQAGAKSSGVENDLEDGFSELETPVSDDAIQDRNEEDGDKDELISEPELSDNDSDVEEPSQSELELSDTETDSIQKRSPKKWVISGLFKSIMDAPGVSIHSALDKWVEVGNGLGRAEISLAMLNLRKRRMYGRALQLSEWLETNKRLDFVERDYASRLDLIAKVRGLFKADAYIEKIPKSFRGEVIYRTLLANCVTLNNLKKAEETFNKMRDLGFPLTTFACNQLLLLYKRVDKKKIADVLLLMEKENIKPSLFTYKILIDTKGQSNDITGMDQIVETMKEEGIEPDINIQAILARHYISGGLKEKAEAVLKEMEYDNSKEKRWSCRYLLPLYAALGKTDEVQRLWKYCESNPRPDECMAAIEAWGKLNKVEEAEAVFNKMVKTQRVSSKHYSALLKLYANHKMLAKGKDLVKQMSDSGCRIGPLTWDALVKLYIEAGEVEKADSILHKAAQKNKMKPMFNSYMTIMDQYAKRGDIHNTEKILHRMRQQGGYVSRYQQFQALIQAYANAKAPAYGIRERMKADNIFPNKAMAEQLAQVDAFKKTAVSDLLD